MLKKIFVFLQLAVVIFLLSSCSKSTKIIKIGFSYQLTGVNSELGRDAMYGSLLAIGEINLNGGINGSQLELVIKDDQGDPDIGVQVDNELMAEGCVAIIGHGTSNMADKTIANANENNFILFSPTISTYTYENIDDNFFRMIPSNSTQGESIAQYLLSHTPGETLVVYEYSNSAYTETVAEKFIQRMASTNYSVSEDNVYHFDTSSSEEYQRISTIINDSEATNVLILGSSFDVSSILQNGVRDDVYIYIPVWATTLDIFISSGQIINYTHGINYYNLSSIEPQFLRFLESYEDKYGLVPSFSSMFSYETVMTLASALMNSKDFKTETIKTELLALGKVNWLIDDLTINQFGDCNRKVYWYHLLNHEFIEVE